MATNAPHTTQPGARDTRNAWDMIASGYDTYVTPTHMRLANRALDHIDIGPHARFLDVASGSGSLAIAAARRGAETLGTDISPGMIELLNANARNLELPNLAGRVMDGQNLDLANDAFDASGSMFGVMLFPDLPRGLREMRRVTRAGGKVLVVAFGPPQQVEFLAFFLRAVKQVVPDAAGLPSDPPPLPFQVANPAVLHERLVEAGLTHVQVETTTEVQEFANAAALWNWVANSNPIGTRLTGSLAPDQATAVREVLDAMLRDRAGESESARLTNPVNIATGTV